MDDPRERTASLGAGNAGDPLGPRGDPDDIADRETRLESAKSISAGQMLPSAAEAAQLFAAADAGEIGHDEAGMLVRTLLSAGRDTTVFTLCNAITCFARHPEQWALLREDPSMARQALEEVLRYDSTFHSFYRTSTRDVELGGITVKAGQKIAVFIASANRDPRRWPDADRFDVTRRATGHMAFGTGIHGCAGQMMARLEGEIVLTALARRVESIRLDGQPVQHFNNTVRGLKSMPVTVTPLSVAVH